MLKGVLVSAAARMVPGMLILGAWPSTVCTTGNCTSIELEYESFLQSGVSMSSPHATGIAAMPKVVQSDWSPSLLGVL